MLHGQTIAQLEEGLAIPLNQFVKNCTTRRSSDCLEDIAHTIFIGKSRLACQESCGEQSVATRRWQIGYPRSPDKNSARIGVRENRVSVRRILSKSGTTTHKIPTSE